jgi:ribosome-associated protein
LIDSASVPTAAKAKGPVLSPEKLHELILKSLDDDQAQDVVSIPLEGKSNIADHMVVASGRSSRQVARSLPSGSSRPVAMRESKDCRLPTGC